MDDSLYFSEQHLAVRNMVREFARSEVAPVAAELDAKAEFPWANIKKMGELGLLGIPWPEELGGAGLDILSYMIVINEMAKVDASHAITISAHTTLGTSPIVNFGTMAQRKRYVPLLASGKVLGGFGLTEPSAGSDAASTRSTDDGTELVALAPEHAFDRGSQRVSLHPEREQDLHHPRRRRRDIRRDRSDGSWSGDEGNQLLHRDEGNERSRQD